jgi:hypothetical protein
MLSYRFPALYSDLSPMENITISGKTLSNKLPLLLWALSPSAQHVLELWPTRSKVATRNSRREQIILGQRRMSITGRLRSSLDRVGGRSLN